jgi:hypothetical protein
VLDGKLPYFILWQVRDEDGADAFTLTGLQTLLTEEYGEAHFNAAGRPSPLIF